MWEVLTAEWLGIKLFPDVTLCIWLCDSGRFEGSCLHIPEQFNPHYYPKAEGNLLLKYNVRYFQSTWHKENAVCYLK
jgi:hypothetical protein